MLRITTAAQAVPQQRISPRAAWRLGLQHFEAPTPASAKPQWGALREKLYSEENLVHDMCGMHRTP